MHVKEENETMEQKKEREKKANKYILKYNHDAITKQINEADWTGMDREENPETITKELQERITDIRKRNEIWIKQTNHYNTKKKIWITRKIMKEIRKRDKLLYKARKEKD